MAEIEKKKKRKKKEKKSSNKIHMSSNKLYDKNQYLVSWCNSKDIPFSMESNGCNTAICYKKSSNKIHMSSNISLKNIINWKLQPLLQKVTEQESQ